MILVVGLNHKTAPIEVREKLAFDGTNALLALQKLKKGCADGEFVLLSTCNRVELYSASQTADVCDETALKTFLAEYHQVVPSEFEHLTYAHRDEQAVSHLLTVASSLDSMVVGEGQILNQVKESYRLACQADSSGKILNRLFHCAFNTAKAVHARTAIGDGRNNVARVAVELAMHAIASVSHPRIVIIGAGEMGELLAKYLGRAGVQTVIVVNRSPARSEKMAERYRITAGAWDDLDTLVGQADVVIAAAAGQDYLFAQEDVKRMLRYRQGRALRIIDIGVPRNFAPEVSILDGVRLDSIDAILPVVQKSSQACGGDIAAAMAIINEEVSGYMRWLGTMEIEPLLGEMREKFAAISENELERFFVGVRRDAACRHVMEPMVKRLVNRLLHCVIKSVHSVAQEHGPGQAKKLVSGIVERADEAGGQGPLLEKRNV